MSNWPLKSPVLGVCPMATKSPVTSSRVSSPVVTSLTTTASTVVSPTTSSTAAFHWKRTFGLA